MEIIRVGIALDDRCFAQALVRGLARECKAMMFVLLNGKEEQDCDLILTSQSSEEGRFVQLVRSFGQDRLEKPPFRLYQYKDSRQMIDDLLFIYFKLTGRIMDYRSDSRCRIFVFTAGSGGCGTTVTSLALTRVMWKVYGRRGLYINLCPINDSRKYLPGEETERFLRLLYYLDTGRDFPMDSFISCGEEMDYISTALLNPYFNQVSPGLLQQLLERLDGLGRYDFLTLDVGNHLERRSDSLLQKADAVVFLWNDREFFPGEYAKIVSREIKKLAGAGIFLSVHNFAEDDSGADKDGIYISHSNELNHLAANGVFSIPLTKSYGIEVTALAEKLAEVLE